MSLSVLENTEHVTRTSAPPGTRTCPRQTSPPICRAELHWATTSERNVVILTNDASRRATKTTSRAASLANSGWRKDLCARRVTRLCRITCLFRRVMLRLRAAADLYCTRRWGRSSLFCTSGLFYAMLNDDAVGIIESVVMTARSVS